MRSRLKLNQIDVRIVKQETSLRNLNELSAFQFVNQHRATFSAIYFKAAKWYKWLITSQAGRYSDSLRYGSQNVIGYGR